MLTGLLVALHALAAVVWVGGMFFAYVILRPSLPPLAGPDRLKLWRRVFGRFFPIVGISILVLLATGYGLIFGVMGGFKGAGVHVHVMHLSGWIMFLIFGHLVAGPWKRFRDAIDTEQAEQAPSQLDRIRQLVAINLGIGLLTVVIGAGGRFW